MLFLSLLLPFLGAANGVLGTSPELFLSFLSKDNAGKWQLKNLENSFVKVTDRLYMAETEVTNQQYNYYLNDLLERKDFTTLMVVKAEKTEWRQLIPEKYRNLGDKVYFPYRFPDDKDYPAQNMTHEGAVKFCEWLTHFYNNDNVDKRKWKKVVFRLPTEDEWMAAARGKNGTAVKYPWGHDKPQNAKGCFLSNFNSFEVDCPTCKVFDDVTKDGGFFTVKADAYFPNDYGLYGMVGNVAEMIATSGVAKGGSWEDIPSECTIQSQKKYTNPSPAIGFRVLMEIIE